MPDSFFTPETDPRLYRCSCGRPECDAATAVNPMLLAFLNELRGRIGRPIAISSGNRCRWHNRQEGGVDDSEHTHPIGTLAADLVIASGRERWELLEANFQSPILFRRLGIGRDFLHVGVSAIHASEVAWTYYLKKTPP